MGGVEEGKSGHSALRAAFPAFGREETPLARLFLARLKPCPSDLWLGLAGEVARASDPTSQKRDVEHPATRQGNEEILTCGQNDCFGLPKRSLIGPPAVSQRLIRGSEAVWGRVYVLGLQPFDLVGTGTWGLPAQAGMSPRRRRSFWWRFERSTSHSSRA